MSDIDSQLPVRSVQDVDERVLVKHQDGDDPGGVGKTQEISEKKAHVRNFSKDSDGTDQEVLLSQEGHTQSNGDYDAVNNKRPSSQGLIVSDRDAAPSETTMNLRPTAVVGEDDTVSQDVAMRHSNGDHIDEENPLPTYQAESPGDEIDNYKVDPAIAKGAFSNHDYTVTVAKDLKSIGVECSASGYAKFELQIETGVATGIFNAVATNFNSTAKPDCDLNYKLKVAAGIIVRVVKTNLDNQTQDLYTQIQGIEI